MKDVLDQLREMGYGVKLDALTDLVQVSIRTDGGYFGFIMIPATQLLIEAGAIYDVIGRLNDMIKEDL